MISNIIRNFNRKEDKEKTTHYLEFKSNTPMTITPNYTNSGVTLQYSLDTKIWTNIGAKGVTPSSNTIYFRGSATGTKTLYTGRIGNAWLFTGATNLEVNGDLTMLLQDTLGGRVRDIPLGTHCYRGMFEGCTSLVIAPSLPSTTLADNCYNTMFYGCTSLVTLPSLPATTLGSNCYRDMFRGCTKIKLSTTKTGGYQTPYRIPYIDTGVSGYMSLDSMFGLTGGTFTGSPTINTTYYTENQVIWCIYIEPIENSVVKIPAGTVMRIGVFNVVDNVLAIAGERGYFGYAKVEVV